MKRKPKLEKPSELIKPVKERTFDELSNDSHEKAKKLHALAIQHGILVDALYKKVKQEEQRIVKEGINMDAICSDCPYRFECRMLSMSANLRESACCIWPRLVRESPNFSICEPRIRIPEGIKDWRKRLAEFHSEHLQ